MFLPLVVMGQISTADTAKTFLTSYEKLLLYGSDYTIRIWYLPTYQVSVMGTWIEVEIHEVTVGNEVDYFLCLYVGRNAASYGEEVHIKHSDLVDICKFFGGLEIDAQGADEVMGGYLTKDNFKVFYTSEANRTKWYLHFNVFRDKTLYMCNEKVIGVFRGALFEMNKIIKERGAMRNIE